MAETETVLAKKVHIYSNGDRFFTGRRFVINPRQTRNYDSFLNQVTLSLKPAFGAVRVLRTPENGHAVNDLNDLETGRSYVACAQKFIKLGYEDITSKPKPAPSPERKNRVIASGKIKKIDRHPISIFVYTNGEVLEPAKKILLKPWVQKTWETVLVAINEKINLRTGAVRHILELTTKDEVTEGVHLKNNEFYIAVGSEKFKDLEYGNTNIILSPKQQQKRRYPTLQPIKKKSKSGNTTDESGGSSPLETSTNSTQSMGGRSDDPQAKQKGKKKTQSQQANNEEGIPIKPIKHKRGSSDKINGAKQPAPPAEDPAKQKAPPPKKQAANAAPTKKGNSKTAVVDLDKDEGGVFKSKGRKQKASEVREDGNVKEEVPIDKREAETVEDEQLEGSGQKKEPLPPIKSNKRSDQPVNKKENEQKQKKVDATKKKSKDSSKPIENDSSKKSTEEEKAENKEEAAVEEDETDKEEEAAVEEDGTDKKEEEAATKIQAGYRGYKARKELKSQKEADNTEDAVNTEDQEDSADTKDESTDEEMEKAAAKIQAGYRGYKTRNELKAAKEKEEAAATKIQAGYRGYKTRKEVNNMKESAAKNTESNEARAPSSQSKSNNDDELENAAVKIQANYRGYRTRKQYAKG